jgi:chemotaxis signal transduction protein
VVALRATDIQSPPSLDGVVDERFVQGIASTQDGMLIVLDVVPLLESRAPGETLQ